MIRRRTDTPNRFGMRKAYIGNRKGAFDSEEFSSCPSLSGDDPKSVHAPARHTMLASMRPTFQQHSADGSSAMLRDAAGTGHIDRCKSEASPSLDEQLLQARVQGGTRRTFERRRTGLGSRFIRTVLLGSPYRANDYCCRSRRTRWCGTNDT